MKRLNVPVYLSKFLTSHIARNYEIIYLYITGTCRYQLTVLLIVSRSSEERC